MDNPYDAEEWAQLVMNSDSVKQERENYQCYDVETVAFNYYSLFQDIIGL